MEQGLFTFADERLWSYDRIQRHFFAKREHLDENANTLSEERRKGLLREITHVAFEGLQREQEKRGREEEVSWLEHLYETTCGGAA